jgi:adenylate cyclase
VERSALFAQYARGGRASSRSPGVDEHGEESASMSGSSSATAGVQSLSSKLEPHQVRAMLNRFYDLLTEIIHEHGGTVLKFVGDEVFAVFGAPLPCENNAQATLDCAIEIQERAQELDRDLADLEIPPVQFGIGMNAGDVVPHVGGGRRCQ